MRYSENHRSETRARIVATAARAMRIKGPDNVGVVSVMADAGLTHGGFYAHFRSRDALLVAALQAAFDEALQRFHDTGVGQSRRRQVEAFVDYYLSTAHRDSPGSGCPLATLAADIHRQSPEFRTTYDLGFRRMVASLSEIFVGEDGPDQDAMAASIFAEMAGVLMLARTLGDRAASDQLLAWGRKSAAKRLLAAIGDDQ